MISSRSVLAAGWPAALTGLGFLARARARRAEALYPPIGRIVTHAGKRVHVLRMGQDAPGRPPVVLIHGASGNLRDFAFALMPKLAETGQVIALDRPGHGYTDRLHERGETPAEQVALLHGTLQALGVEGAILLGYSMGGAVALAWALEHPGFVRGLVLASGVSHPWPGGIGWLYASAAHPVTGAVVVPAVAITQPRGLIEKTIRGVHAPQPVPAGYTEQIGPELALRAHAILANTRQAAVLKPHLRAMAARYPQLSMPVEILHGLADRTVPAAVHGEPLARLLPSARYQPLAGIGHAPHHHAQDAICTAIARIRALQPAA